MRAHFLRRREDDRGAVAVMVALALTVLLLVVGLTVEVGAQRVKSRDMPGLANIASMDLSRRIDGQAPANQLKPTMDSALERTLSRNDYDDPAVNVEYTLGTMNAQGEFVASAGTQVPSAVKVVASETAEWGILQATRVSTRSAIAAGTISEGGDCFSIGSYKGVLGTSGEYGLNAFFQKMFGQAITFGNTSTAANWDWAKIASEEINMTAVGQLMGYSTIEDFRNADVNLGEFYVALYTHLSSTNESPETLGHVGAVRNMINNVGPLPMDRILGNGLKGTVTMGALDVLGGMMTYYNDRRSVNPNFDSTWTSLFSQGPTNITYDQGPKQHCAEAGETFSTQGADPNRQIHMQLNGTLTPQTFNTRFTAPGLFDTTGDVQLGYMGLGLEVEPTVLKMKSVQCTPSSKTAVFDLTKGSITMSLPGPQGGTTHAGSQWPGQPVNIPGYGLVHLEWGFPLQFKAKLDLAPSVNNVVTATEDTIDEPLYILGNESKFTIDVDAAINSFNYFRVVNPPGQQWQDHTNSFSAADQRKIKRAIVMAYINPLIDRSTPNSFFNNYVNGSLGFSGSSVWGTSVMFESLTCGGSGGEVTSTRIIG